MSPVSPEDTSNTFLHDSPTSTLGSNSHKYLEHSNVRDDRLPEVAGDTSPLALTNMEAEYQRQYDQHYYEQYKPLQSPKSATHYEEDAAKVVVPSEFDSNVQFPQTAVTTHMPVPWDTSTMGRTTTSVTSKPEGSFAHEDGGKGGKQGKILGMSRKAFFILLAVLVIIVVAAVGGGVGGAVAASKAKSDSAPAPAPATTTSSTPPTSSPPTSTSSTSSAAAATSSTSVFLNNQTSFSGDGFAFQGFSADNYTGVASQVITQEGGQDFPFDLHSYVWLPNTTDCCLSFCQNATQAGVTGWWCNKRFQKDASETFTRIFVWCGNTHDDAHAKCN